MAPKNSRARGGAIAFILRHATDVELDSVGWLPLTDIVTRLAADDILVTVEDVLREVGPDGNDRFELSIDGTKARAFYGHSNPNVQIDLIDVNNAPQYLYHATPEFNLDAILDRKEGLLPQKRLYVHMHEDPMRAVKVGNRRNAPIALFEIETTSLPEPVGRTSPDSAVWLTTFVPAKLLWKIAIPNNRD
jgi:putative RNA 2'-phosphotransferase